MRDIQYVDWRSLDLLEGIRRYERRVDSRKRAGLYRCRAETSFRIPALELDVPASLSRRSEDCLAAIILCALLLHNNVDRGVSGRRRHLVCRNRLSFFKHACLWTCGHIH